MNVLMIMCNNENVSDGGIEDQVENSETESNSEESSENEWVLPVSDSRSKFKRVRFKFCSQEKINHMTKPVTLYNYLDFIFDNSVQEKTCG